MIESITAIMFITKRYILDRNSNQTVLLPIKKLTCKNWNRLKSRNFLSENNFISVKQKNKGLTREVNSERWQVLVGQPTNTTNKLCFEIFIIKRL